jgi:hypothetical protein
MAMAVPQRLFVVWQRFEGIPPPKAVCPDLLIGVKSMAYVMRYNHFPD